MAIITRLEAKNFKSFANVGIDLRPFNVLIGANASGKSNVIAILRFVRDIAQNGLDNAISMQGGARYLRNMKIGSSQPLSIRVVVAFQPEEETTFIPGDERWMLMKVSELAIDFALHLIGERYKIVKDNVEIKGEFFGLDMDQRPVALQDLDNLGRGELKISKGKIKIDRDRPGSDASSQQRILQGVWQKRGPSANELIIENPTSISPTLSVLKVFGNVALFDFDPKLPKKAVAITGRMDLEEDGNNLAIVLKNIVKNAENKRKFSNLMKDVLPFVHDLGIENLADRSLFFKVREAYSAPRYLPASLLSDGTINISALIAALFFERKPIIVIEEPERNMHPHLASRVVDMLKEASKHKQILITTHNPEVVKHVGLENLLLVSRNNEGYSEVSKPEEIGMVKTFLRNEIGIDELFVQNLLGV